MNTPTTTDAAIVDDFRGDTEHLVGCIKALISLSDAGAMKPHGLGGHARALLSAAAIRLSTETPATAHGGEQRSEVEWLTVVRERDSLIGELTTEANFVGHYTGLRMLMARAAAFISATPKHNPCPPAGGFVVDRITEAPFYWRHCKQDAEDGYCNGWNDCVAAHASPTAQPSAKDGVRGGKWHGPTLDAVLRGLRSEDDSTQLRAIISSVETMREEATTAAGLVDGLLSDTVGNLRRMASDEFDGCNLDRLNVVIERLEAAIGREVGK